MKFTKDRRYWFGLIGLGLILRIIFSSFLFHSDLKNNYRHSKFLEQGFNYAYEKGAAESTPLHYPPPIYLITYIHEKVDRFMFSPYFDNWLNDGTNLQTQNNKQVFRDLFAMKLPLMLADLITLAILLLIVKPDERKLIAGLWLLNPVTLYAIYGFGNLDIFPAMFVALAVLFTRKRPSLAYISLGLAAGFKLFAVFLIPLWFIIDNRNFRNKLLGVVLSLTAFGLTMLPIINSAVAIKSVFLSNLSATPFKTVLTLAENHILPLSFVTYAVVVFYLLTRKVSFEAAAMASLGLLLGVSHFHPQWIIWVMPLIVLLVAQKKIDWRIAALTLISYFGVVLLIDDNYVSYGLLKPVNESADTLFSIRFMVDRIGLGEPLQGLFQAFFLGGIVAMSLQAFGLMKLAKTSLKEFKIKYASLAWIAGIILVFGLINIIFTMRGRYYDVLQLTQNKTITLTNSTTVSQEITVHHDNWMSFMVHLKNPNLANKEDLHINIKDTSGNPVVSQIINGASIKDDYDLAIYFPKIPNTAGKSYTVELSSPTSPPKNELQVTYKDTDNVEGMVVNGEPVTGVIAYATYYNPGNYWDNLVYSIRNIIFH